MYENVDLFYEKDRKKVRSDEDNKKTQYVFMKSFTPLTNH